MDGDTLKEKLRARRRAINVTLQSQSPSDTFMTSTGDDEVMDLTQESGEEDIIDEESEAILRSALESRREKSKRRLEIEEMDQSANETTFQSTSDQTFVDDLRLSPRTTTPTPSHGLPSPRTDDESRSNTPLGRSGQHSTLRSRLQAKLLASKKSSGNAGEESPFRAKRLRDTLNRSTRFTASIRQRDLEEESELMKRIESKLKWKHAVEEAKAQHGEPTEADCYDFFTKPFEDVPPEPDPVDEPVVPGEAEDTPQEEGEGLQRSPEEANEVVSPEEESHPVDEAGDQKKLIADIISKDLDWRLFFLTAAEYKGYNKQIEIENLTYFVPSKLSPNMSSKVEEDAVPRHLEDEGFYVGEKPVTHFTNKSILENRLLRQSGRGQRWFGLDGQVEALPDPVKQVQTKPWVETLLEVDHSIVTVYTKAYVQEDDDKYLQGSEENELQIDIGTVVFHHHPLMSREHVLASNINQMYDEYIEKQQKNFVNFFIEKLAALRNAVETMKNKSVSFSTSDVKTQESRIHDFMSEIRRTTRQLNDAESSERELMRRIIEEWKEIKSLREFQGFTNTTAKLIVQREEVNPRLDRQKWEKEVENEVLERKEEHEVTLVLPYQEALKKYQSQLQAWKKNRQKIKEERKKSSGLKQNLLASTEQDDEAEITIAGNIDKPQKPDKPKEFDEEVERVDVINALLASRRNPGEDKISVQLTNTANITPTSGVPAGEAARRKAMQKAAILLKIRFNGKEVFSTEPKTLTTDFKLHFGSIFRIRIAQWPESLKVQFLDVGMVVNTVFSEVFLRVPETNVHSGNVQLGVLSFHSYRTESFDHEGVGSNTPFKLRKNDTVPTSYNTKGQLICSISWGLDEEGRVLAPKGLVSNDPMSVINPLKNIDPVKAIGAEGIQDPASLSKWVQDNRLDPNDPDNATLIPFMQGEQEGHGFLYAPDYFRLEQLQEEFNFITDKEYDQLNRFRLLKLRADEANEFRNITMIPCHEHEIMDSTFTTYDRRIRDKQTIMTSGEKLVEGGTVSSYRLEVMQYREAVKEAVLQRFYSARHRRLFEDVVREEQVPDIGTLGLSMAKLFEHRRPLKPVRKERKKATAQTLSEGSVNILVNVVRAYNVPTRQGSHTSGGLNNTHNLTSRFGGGTQTSNFASTMMGGVDFTPETYNVSPFVAISFQDNVVTTRTAQGPSPSWNEELQIPFSAPNNDYNASNLQTVDDIIYIHLFDRVIDEAPQQYGQEDSSLVTHKITNHWLGTFRLPFSTVYQRGKVDGTFKLNVPPVLLGYDLEKPAPHDYRDQFETQAATLTSGTFITLFITLEPTLKPVEPVHHKFESQEDEAVLNMSATYLTDCNKKFPNRNAKTTVIDLKGESVLITRYIKPLQPPADLLEGCEPSSLTSAERVARLVSLIPFVSDNVTYAGICDLWSTSDQFIQMMSGDEEEHAVLLVNFFLHLGKRAFLLLGNAVPEGSTAYVLTIEDTTKEKYIWNASTGNHYTHTDYLCPLKSVGMLVNDQNIWFNIQSQDIPSRVRYDLTRTSDWKPFFTPKFPHPGTLHSVQPDMLYFAETDRGYVVKLAQIIKDKLKEKMMSWRPRHVTRWNRACEGKLLEILKGLEYNRFRRGGDTNHAAELLTTLGEVRFTGFPMDFPFTDVDTIITAVRSTEVHKIQDPNVEFALSVYIHPYPASILAVWVYVAALVNRRRNDPF